MYINRLLINLTKKLTKPVLEPDLLHKLIAATNSSLCETGLEGSQEMDVDVLQVKFNNYSRSREL